MKFISSTPAGTKQVYDIGVPDTHNFVLANGLVSHNCFNKSHSVSYSKITYVCAWLKATYPEEFFCGLMTTRSRSLQPKDWAMKAPQFIHEAKLLGVSIHAPTINASKVGFTIRDRSVYFGLNAIKGIGIGAARSIIQTRGNKPFTSIKDFITRINSSKVNTGVFQSLVMSGAFDRMGYRRKDLIAATPELYQCIKDVQTYYERIVLNKEREEENKTIEPILEKRNELRRIKRLKKERDLTPEEEAFLEETKGLRLHRLLKNAEEEPEFPSIQRYKQVKLSVVELMQQAEYIGCYIGTHPASIIFPHSTRIGDAEINEKQSLSGVVSNVREYIDKNGNKMAFLEFGDGTGIVDAVIFARTYSRIIAEHEARPITNAEETLKKPIEPGDLIEVYGEVTENDPDVKMKVYTMRKYRSDT